MKNILLFTTMWSVWATVTEVNAQKNIVTDTLTVRGVCGDCKKRIEDAAYGKGVKHADWEIKNDRLTVIYRSDKTTLEAIEQRIAKAGHTTRNVPAREEDYKKLPACCQYDHNHKH